MDIQYAPRITACDLEWDPSQVSGKQHDIDLVVTEGCEGHVSDLLVRALPRRDDSDGHIGSPCTFSCPGFSIHHEKTNAPPAIT